MIWFVCVCCSCSAFAANNGRCLCLPLTGWLAGLATSSRKQYNQTETSQKKKSNNRRRRRNNQDFENHRTSTEYEDSLVAKLFCFTFCNSYGGFVYLAFIGEPVVGVDCERSCMSLLATNLTIVFVVQLLVRKRREEKGRRRTLHLGTSLFLYVPGNPGFIVANMRNE